MHIGVEVEGRTVSEVVVRSERAEDVRCQRVGDGRSNARGRAAWPTTEPGFGRRGVGRRGSRARSLMVVLGLLAVLVGCGGSEGEDVASGDADIVADQATAAPTASPAATATPSPTTPSPTTPPPTATPPGASASEDLVDSEPPVEVAPEDTPSGSGPSLPANRCALLDPAEIERVFGVPVTFDIDGFPSDYCRWRAISAEPGPGADSFGFLAGDDPLFLELAGVENAAEVAGPWDSGWYKTYPTGQADLIFVSGDVLVITSINGGAFLGNPPVDRQAELVELATIIIGAL